MGKLILIRHGETEHNKKGVFYGWKDPDLNETGVTQCEETYKKLQDYFYTQIFSSPLKRARQTCGIINYLNLEVVENDAIKEMNFGIFEGYTYEEILVLYPEEVKLSQEKWETYNYKTGESPTELQNRVVKFIDEHVDLENETTVLVTHWGVICALLSHYFSDGIRSYWKFAVKNGGIVVIDFKEGFPVLEKFM